MIIVTPSAELEWATPDAIVMIERAGRTCYKSEAKITPDSAEQFVRGIVKMGHEAMLEHAVASFRFICDRGVTHELVRHRIASFAQESTRYVNYGRTDGQIKVILPPDLDTSCDLADWTEACQAAEKAYLSLVSRKVKPQIARSVLPTCLKTEIVCTMNFREWRHALKLRTAKAAHPQIAEIMRYVLVWFKATYPVIVEDLEA